MVRDFVLQTQAAEPAVGQVQLHLVAQTPLRADRIAVADQKHANHQLGANRRTTKVTIVRLHLATQPTQIKNRVDPPQQMIARNHVFQVELVEKTVLPAHQFAHHRRNPFADSANQGKNANPIRATDLFNSLGYTSPS